MSGAIVAFLERVEASCANAVERAFALAFPVPVEPVHVARKLVGAFESASAASGRAGRRFHVRFSPVDAARFRGELPYLTAQWTAMLGRLAERSGQPQQPPDVVVDIDPTVATGTVSIGVESLHTPTRLSLRVRRGVPPDAAIELRAPLVVGRDPACDLVLVDTRVSRRHLAVDANLQFTDLGSANGTQHNGVPATTGILGLGDVLTLGDSELAVEGLP